MHTRGVGPAAGADGVGDAATRLAQDTAELARREIRAIQDEIMAGVRRFGAGGLLGAGAGVCGILALWAAQETVLRGAEWSCLGPAPRRFSPALTHRPPWV
ncbi:phage holin family protein [Streptomyces sp. NPDC048362]|uniref:phage holin family protein n=1 Tax=Streptomyces sp. NPDC048362 TaxID=3365539 RepID=UPI003713EDEE